MEPVFESLVIIVSLVSLYVPGGCTIADLCICITLVYWRRLHCTLIFGIIAMVFLTGERISGDCGRMHLSGGLRRWIT